jgi:hypothetical protein
MKRVSEVMYDSLIRNSMGDVIIETSSIVTLTVTSQQWD